MVLASGFQLMRGEYGLMSLTLLLGAVAAFVAYGRLVLRPIEGEEISPSAILKGLAGVAVALLLAFSTLTKGWNK